MQKKQIFTYSLKIIFSGILLFWLYKNGALDFSMLWNCPQPIYLVTAFFVFFLVTVIGNYRWHLLLSSQSRSYSFFFTLKLSLMGLFFNFALPSSVGGDVLKAYYLSRADAHLSKSKAMISVFVDRVLGLLAMLSLAIVSIFWNYDKISANLQLRSIALVISALFVFLCLFTIAAFSKFLSHSRFHKINHLPLGPTFMHVYQSISSFGEKKSLVLRCLILSVVVQSVAVFFFIFVAQALGSNELPWGLFFFAVPIGFVAMAIPLSPGGLGIGQLAFYSLYNIFLGYESQVGVLSISIFQIYQLFFGLLGLFFFVIHKNAHKHEASAT